MLPMKPLTERSNINKPKIAFCLNGSGIVTLSGSERSKRVYAIDVMDLSIVKHIPSNYDLTGEDVFVLAYLSYLYTLRLADTRMMRRLTTVTRDVVTITKDNVFMSLDLVKYKIATLRCVIHQLTPAKHRPQIEQHFIDCGLKREDAILYILLCDNNDIQEFIMLVLGIEDKTFLLDVNTLSREIDLSKRTISEFEKAATYHTWSKLRFIAQGNRFDFTDLKHDLMLRAVQAYYWVRPFHSIDHAVNYAKSSIRGYTQCMIDYYNKEDRRRTVSTPDGFDNVIREISDDVFSVINHHETEDALIEYLDEKRAYA